MARPYYIIPQGFVDSGTQRGGVVRLGGADYELEVGIHSFASEEMLALCVLHDEVMGFLRSSDSPVAKEIVQNHAQIVDDMLREQDEKRVAVRAELVAQRREYCNRPTN